VFISVVGTAGNVILSSYAAYALSKLPFPGRNTLFKVIVYSLMFNATVVGITMFILMSTFQWIDTYLAIIIPAFCTTYGLYLMKQFMETSVPDEVLESARIEGASENRIFWKIAMPMVKPAWITLIIFAFKDLWNTGANMYIYSEQLKTFNYAISQLVTSGISRTGVSAAATVVMMIVPILVFVISQSNIIQTMSTSGMKD
jgi:ABC-type glycerol-3-phosphate transport system permease component